MKATDGVQPTAPPGYVLLPIDPKGGERERLLRALEDASEGKFCGTVEGAAGHLYAALVEAASGVDAAKNASPTPVTRKGEA